MTSSTHNRTDGCQHLSDGGNNVQHRNERTFIGLPIMHHHNNRHQHQDHNHHSRQSNPPLDHHLHMYHSHLSVGYLARSFSGDCGSKTL